MRITLSQSNQNTPYSKSSNGDDFVLKEECLGVDTTSPNTNDSSPPQHGIRGSEGHISGNLNKAIEGRQRAIAAGNQLKQDWLDAEHWRALAKARNYRLPHWYLPLILQNITCMRLNMPGSVSLTFSSRRITVSPGSLK